MLVTVKYLSYADPYLISSLTTPLLLISPSGISATHWTINECISVQYGRTSSSLVWSIMSITKRNYTKRQIELSIFSYFSAVTTFKWTNCFKALLNLRSSATIEDLHLSSMNRILKLQNNENESTSFNRSDYLSSFCPVQGSINGCA